jgi:hypothetical protein
MIKRSQHDNLNSKILVQHVAVLPAAQRYSIKKRPLAAVFFDDCECPQILRRLSYA